MDDGVSPAKLPSSSISALPGDDRISSMVGADEELLFVGEATGIAAWCDCPTLWNFAESNGKFPLIYAVISVPFGTVMSLPCMKRKNGAAGQNTIAVATIPPVIAPVCPPPFTSFTARS